MLTEPWQRVGFDDSVSSHESRLSMDKHAKIIELNDQLRTTFKGGASR